MNGVMMEQELAGKRPVDMQDGPIVVLGAAGQVGSALVAELGTRSAGLARPELDLADPDGAISLLERLNPSVVINAAAYTQVDRAESEEELAMAINGHTPGVIAAWCAEREIPFVHYSTDYVFSGEADRPYVESDRVGPLSAYGRTKLEGERRIAEAGGRWLIFRTSWVYDAAGRNFLKTMLRLGADRQTLSVVDDQHGAPTYAPHLAHATLVALEQANRMPAFPSGIYHLTNAGSTTWCGFARAIFDSARAAGFPLAVEQVIGIPTSEYPTPARRPTNSRLDCSLAARTLGVRLPDWQAGLSECLEVLSTIQQR